MTASGNGTFKYVSSWLDPDSLLAAGAVSATYQGGVTNAQLVISHGCRPFDDTKPAWCSPGFWGQSIGPATDKGPGSWQVIGVDAATTMFNATVPPVFYGAALDPDAALGVVLTTTGGTYKTPQLAGTSGCPLTPFNAAGAYLTNLIPGYHFDCDSMQGNESDTCPLDHHRNFTTTVTP
jgi:hypothetical protein